MNKIDDFIAEYGFYAAFVGEATDFPKDLILAHAALETGWGLYANGNNLFGIKNLPFSWGTAVMKTKEYFGKWEERLESFQKFPSVIHSMLAYVWKIRTEERYAKAWRCRFIPEDYFRELSLAGYATDPDFAEKLTRVYKTIKEVL